MSAEPVEEKSRVVAGHLVVAHQHVQEVVTADAQAMQLGRRFDVIRPGLATKCDGFLM
jgi:hypothetical protein